MKNKTANIIAAILLTITFILSVFSIKNMSLTMDELAHLPAGYSYLTQKDYRMNPEHPPLVKDLSAVPLLFMHLNFPKDHPSWTEKGKDQVNEQWWFGNQFLFHSGNNADKVIFFARLPMILLLLLLGWLIFYWAKKLGGNSVGLLSLFIFCFSPTFIAHGRIVTTDVGAALGSVLATYFYLKFLKNPKKSNIILAGISLGIALLLKFSCAVLVPFFILITLIYALLPKEKFSFKFAFKSLLKYALSFALICVIAALVIWPVYEYHLINYPIEKQIKDSEIILHSNPHQSLSKLDIEMIKNPLLRPYSYYALGVLMASQREAGGNTTYFLGNISGKSWWYYFPVVYLLKIPIAFHLLELLALAYIIFVVVKSTLSKKLLLLIRDFVKKHFTEFSMLIFIAIYWYISMTGNLNIGIRHIMPTLPFIYILVCLTIKKSIDNASLNKKIKSGIILSLLVLVILYALPAFLTFPNYISYFNILAGGPKQGYKYVVDSNYDWGQDLKRLNKWVNENKVSKIYVDYFGGADVKYYLKDKYQPWDGRLKTQKDFPKGNYLAVSATLLQGGRGKPTKEYGGPSGYYNWLNKFKPVARAGNSIFIYYIN